MRLFFILMLLSGGLFSCSKNDDAISLRKLLFKENADSITIALKTYSYFPSTARTNLFNEEFTSNVSGWPIYNQFTNAANYDGFALLQNGQYYISGSGGSSKYFYINKIIDTSKNFEIVFKVQNLDEMGGNLFSRQGLFFSGSLTTNKLTATGLFMKAGVPDNFFSVRTIVNDETFGNETGVNISANYIDELVFRKVKNKYSSFVNGKNMSLADFNTLHTKGNLFGFSVVNRMKVESVRIDYLTF